MSQPYLVSARKYRPQTFDSVVGQSHITTTLKNAIRNDQLAHAYLFFGPRGVGKTTCARILAKTINCETPTEDLEACGTCTTCKAFDENANMNIFELDAASHNSVDDIRNLNEQVRFVPQQGKYKVYIIDEVHMLTTSAFNAFLKTLEEPPHYAVFILATTEKHKVLPTILSRCQVFDFKRIQIADIANHLASICDKEGVSYDMNALHTIAQKAEGGMRDALSIMDRIASFSNGQITYDNVIEHLNILDAKVYFDWTEAFLKQDFGQSLLYLDQYLNLGFEGDIIIAGLAEHIRNLLMSQDPRLLKLVDLPESFKAQYFHQAKIIDENFLLNALSIINKAELDYKITLNKRLLLEVTLIKLAQLQHLFTGNNSLAEAKKKSVTEGTSTGVPTASETVSQQQVAATPTPEQTTSQSSSNHPIPAAAPIETSTPMEQSPPAASPVETSPAPVQQQSQEPIVENPPIVEQPAASNVPPAATTSAPPKLKAPVTLKGSRSKDLLAQLHQDNSVASMEARQIPITKEVVFKFLEEYKDSLKLIPEKAPYLDQMNLFDIQYISPEEIRIITTNGMSHGYAETISDEFRDFLRAKTLDKVVRIHAILDESQREEVVIEKPKTKLDTFKEMIDDFPYLEVLRSKFKFDVE